jgi:DNA-binding MarR family transcriptional regulator
MGSSLWNTITDRPPVLDRTHSVVHPGWFNAHTRLADAEIAEEEDETRAVQFAAFAQLMRTAGALDRAATDILAELGVTAGAFFALLELEAAGGPGLAPSELARRLAVARRTATLYVDILLKHGWVSRSAHPEDKRMILATLTDEGRDLLETIGRSYKEQLARLVDALNLSQAVKLHELLNVIPLESDTLRCGFLQLDGAEVN